MFKNSFFKIRYTDLLVTVIVIAFILPGGVIYGQSIDGNTLLDTAQSGEDVYDALNPFSAGPSACGVSGEGLCQSSCGPYDNIISASTGNGLGSYCSENEQCCVPSKCGYNNNEGIGECKSVSNCGDLIGKNTSDCTPPKLCCITPKIPELNCPGGVCSEENSALEDSLPVVCSGDFQSDFCEDYTSNCSQDQGSLICQQTLINLTNNATVLACSESSDLSGCLTLTVACSKDQNSSDCQSFIAKGTAEKGACSQSQTSSECRQFLAENASSGGSVPSFVLACVGSSDFSKCLKALSAGSLERNTSKWEGLVPCTGFNKSTGELDCTLCSVFELIKRIINWLVEFIVAISVGFIIWAGISMMSSGGDPSKLTKAKEMLTTAILGVALAFGGWLIIGTLLGVLTGSENIMPWNKITCDSKPIKLSAEVPKLSANCTSAGGVCQNKTTTECAGGEYEPGLCAGSTNIQCCIPSANQKACTSVGGKCQNDSLSCSGGKYEDGLCPGTAANIRCCKPILFVDIKNDESVISCAKLAERLDGKTECIPEAVGVTNSERTLLSEGICDNGLKCYQILDR